MCRFRRGRPFVTLKVGMSLDGKTALGNGQSQWITGPAARGDVQRLRARSCAVLTGIGTVLADDPALTVRDPRFDLGGTPPARVVLDATLRLDPAAQLFATPGPVYVFTTGGDTGRRARQVAAGARVETVAAGPGGVDLPAVLARLGELAVNEVLAECGPRLAGALLAAGLIDELVCYLAPTILGSGARSAFALADFEVLAQCPALDIVETSRVGPDLRIVARPASA
jgi:diaminohydroxyphosphoribosylaminopyrimidine deaminase/5-amino-6-(5-phosphoribosylamino)uracil reductase